MKEAKLLYGARIRMAPFKRNFVMFRSLTPERLLQYLAMDIKYVHVHGAGRNALLLTSTPRWLSTTITNGTTKKGKTGR